MREHTPKISTLVTQTVVSVEKRVVVEDIPELSISYRLRMFLTRTLFGLQNGVVLVFSLAEKLYKERLILDVLKKAGFVTSYSEGVLYCDYPRFNFFGISFKIDNDVQYEQSLHSWGYTLPGEDKAIAIKKALWESFERQSTYYSRKATTISYPRFVKGDASFLYAYIPKYTEAQTTRHDFLVRKKEDMVDMVGFKAKSLTGDSSRFFPMQSFFWGESYTQGEKYFQQTTTSGSGGGYTREYATLSALYELIERDHFLLFWFSRIKPTLIEIGETKGIFFDHVRNAKKHFNLEVYFLNLKYDIDVYVCACVIIDPVLNIVSFGAKASSQGEATLKGAYLEALATLNLIRNRNKRVSDEVLLHLIANKEWGCAEIDKTARVNLYNSELGVKTIRNIWLRDNQKISHEDFVSQTESKVNEHEALEGMTDELKRLVKEKGEGYHTYVHEFSSEITKKYGYHASHVFIPAFLKMHLREEYVAPLSERLTEFARLHGVTVQSEKDLNHLPHPFP